MHWGFVFHSAPMFFLLICMYFCPFSVVGGNPGELKQQGSGVLTSLYGEQTCLLVFFNYTAAETQTDVLIR